MSADLRGGKKKKIALIYYNTSTFVRKDYEMLSRHYQVEEVIFRGAPDIPKLIGAIRRSDVAVSWFAGGHAFLAVLLSKLYRKGSVIIVGGFEVAKLPEINYGQFTLGWNARMYTKLAFKYADVVFVVDLSLKEDAIKNAGISGENFDYLPTGYNPKKFKPSGSKEKLVLTVGFTSCEVIKRKGLDTFVKAARSIPEAKFVLVGTPIPEAVDYLKKMAPDNVEFAGYIPEKDLIRYYQRAKVYCQLSAYEGLPNALCEAMLCECIPVGTERNGIPTAIGDTGFYVPFGDLDATVEAIKKALNATDDLGKRARKRIEDLFPEGRRESGFIKAINGLIDKENSHK